MVAICHLYYYPILEALILCLHGRALFRQSRGSFWASAVKIWVHRALHGDFKTRRNIGFGVCNAKIGGGVTIPPFGWETAIRDFDRHSFSGNVRGRGVSAAQNWRRGTSAGERAFSKLRDKRNWEIEKKRWSIFFLSLESENLNCVSILMLESKGNRRKIIIKKEWPWGVWGKSRDGTRSLNKLGVCRRKQMRNICVTEEGRRGRGGRIHNLPLLIWNNFQACWGRLVWWWDFVGGHCSAGAWAVSDAGVGQMGWEAEGCVPQGQNTWEGTEVEWQSLALSVEKKERK